MNVEPWMVELALTVALAVTIVLFFAWMGTRDRERNERETFERFMKGKR